MCLTLYFATCIKTYINKDGEIYVRQHKFYAIGILIALLLFAFCSGVRWDVGKDHLNYVMDYKTVGVIGDVYRHDMERGYVYLMKLFNSMNIHFSCFLGLMAFLQLGFIYYAFKDVKYIISFLGIFIMCGGDFFFWMNGIRQALVATFFVCLLTHCVVKKKFVLYLFCLLIASYIHKSALLLIILYPLAYLNIDNIFFKRNVQYIIFLSAIFLSSTNIWTHLLEVTDTVFSFIGYDDRFKMAYIEDDIREQNFGVRKFIFLIIDFIIIYFSSKLRSLFSDRIFAIMYISYFILIVIQPLLVNSLVFNRITGYFYIFRAIVSAYLLFYLLKVDRTQINKRIGYFVMLLYILHLFIQIYLDKGGHTGCIRYCFFWDNVN